jgi:hypothetical protein
MAINIETYFSTIFNALAFLRIVESTNFEVFGDSKQLLKRLSVGLLLHLEEEVEILQLMLVFLAFQVKNIYNSRHTVQNHQTKNYRLTIT